MARNRAEKECWFQCQCPFTLARKVALCRGISVIRTAGSTMVRRLSSSCRFMGRFSRRTFSKTCLVRSRGSLASGFTPWRCGGCCATAPTTVMDLDSTTPKVVKAEHPTCSLTFFFNPPRAETNLSQPTFFIGLDPH